MRIVIGSALACAVVLAGCESCPDEAGVACRYIGLGESPGLDDDGTSARDADIYFAMDMEFSPDGTPYFIDWNNHIIRRVIDGRVETIVGTDIAGDGPEEGNDFTAPGVLGTEVRLNHPTDLQFDDEGNLIFAAWHNHKLRYVDTQTGLCMTLIGRGPGYSGDGESIDQALLNQPSTIVRTTDGRIFILDQRNHRIRLIDTDGIITTVVGNGMPGFSGDGGDPLLAQLRFEAGPNPEPSGGMAYDEENDLLYISDGLNHVIRRVDFGANVIETIIGTPETPGYAGDGGSGLDAQVNHVRNVEIGPDGRIYFADTENHRVRVWDPTTDVVETVAGTGVEGNGLEGFPAIDTDLNRPMGVAFGPDDALYVGDTLNHRFLRIPQ